VVDTMDQSIRYQPTPAHSAVIHFSAATGQKCPLIVMRKETKVFIL
jgi:hypothetical protein